MMLMWRELVSAAPRGVAARRAEVEAEARVMAAETVRAVAEVKVVAEARVSEVRAAARKEGVRAVAVVEVL